MEITKRREAEVYAMFGDCARAIDCDKIHKMKVLQDKLARVKTAKAKEKTRKELKAAEAARGCITEEELRAAAIQRRYKFPEIYDVLGGRGYVYDEKLKCWYYPHGTQEILEEFEW